MHLQSSKSDYTFYKQHKGLCLDSTWMFNFPFQLLDFFFQIGFFLNVNSVPWVRGYKVPEEYTGVFCALCFWSINCRIQSSSFVNWHLVVLVIFKAVTINHFKVEIQFFYVTCNNPSSKVLYTDRPNKKNIERITWGQNEASDLSSERSKIKFLKMGAL